MTSKKYRHSFHSFYDFSINFRGSNVPPPPPPPPSMQSKYNASRFSFGGFVFASFIDSLKSSIEKSGSHICAYCEWQQKRKHAWKKIWGKKDILLISMSLNSHSNASFNERFFCCCSFASITLITGIHQYKMCSSLFTYKKLTITNSCRFSLANFRFFCVSVKLFNELEVDQSTWIW